MLRDRKRIRRTLKNKTKREQKPSRYHNRFVSHWYGFEELTRNTNAGRGLREAGVAPAPRRVSFRFAVRVLTARQKTARVRARAFDARQLSDAPVVRRTFQFRRFFSQTYNVTVTQHDKTSRNRRAQRILNKSLTSRGIRVAVRADGTNTLVVALFVYALRSQRAGIVFALVHVLAPLRRVPFETGLA